MRQQLWDKTSIVFAVGIFLTFVAFDVIWCMDTTFASFSFFETYATKIIATLALAGVYALTRCRWAQIVVMALLDVLLVANLMYFRTYYSAIPASSYLEAGNLADFKASVTDSLRWADIVLPLIRPATLVCLLLSFVRSLADFGTPIIIGGRFSTLAADIYLQVVGYSDLEKSSAMNMFLLVPSILFFFVYRALMRRSDKLTDASRAARGDLGLRLSRCAPRF